MSYFSFPPPTTCEFCGTTQNGICPRRACIDARLGRSRPDSVEHPLPKIHPSGTFAQKSLQENVFPSGYVHECERGVESSSIRVRKDGWQVGSIHAVLKRDQEYPYYEASGLYVEIEHRHLGLGRALVHLLLDECRGREVRGVAQSFGSDPIGKKRLVQFYRRCGARVSRFGTITWLSRPPFVDEDGTLSDSSLSTTPHTSSPDRLCT